MTDYPLMEKAAAEAASLKKQLEIERRVSERYSKADVPTASTDPAAAPALLARCRELEAEVYILKKELDMLAGNPEGGMDAVKKALDYRSKRITELEAEVERLQIEVKLLTDEHNDHSAILTELALILEHCEHYGHLVQSAKDLKAQRDRLKGALVHVASDLHIIANGGPDSGTLGKMKNALRRLRDGARAALADVQEQGGEG